MSLIHAIATIFGCSSAVFAVLALTLAAANDISRGRGAPYARFGWIALVTAAVFAIVAITLAALGSVR